MGIQRKINFALQHQSHTRWTYMTYLLMKTLGLPKPSLIMHDSYQSRFHVNGISKWYQSFLSLLLNKQQYRFDFERVHPIVFILMYWIYLLPSTQQPTVYNGFTTCFDSHESSSGYVQNLSVLAVLLLTVSGGCWSVWSGGCPYIDMNENLRTYIKKCY
jgi:hypothetical protein